VKYETKRKQVCDAVESRPVIEQRRNRIAQARLER